MSESETAALAREAFYLDVFGFVRDRETTACVGRWQEMSTATFSGTNQ